MKKILITGITGFAGSWLAQYLSSQEKTEIIGTYLNSKTHRNVANLENRIRLVQCNLLKKENVEQLIKEEKPDAVYHLAAIASPALSFKEPESVLTNNIASELYVFEALRSAELTGTKILIVSSADVYGKVEPADLPIDEETKMQPTNPYAVSKIAQDYLALQYFLSYSMPIIRIRPFNHIGPRQSADFVVSSFARQIAEIEKGKKEAILSVGNLDTRRDFTDVRDMACAYSLALEKGVPGAVYNIGTDKSQTIKETLLTLLSFSKIDIAIQEDDQLIRPTDTQELLCDSTKFRKKTGWQPEIPIEQTLKDTLDYWRSII